MKVHEKSCLGRRCYGFNLFRQLEEKDYTVISVPEVVVEDASAENSLFDMMFSVNPLTKLPQGDVSLYLSDKTSPDVKRFIEMQLLSPNNISADAAAEYSSLSDDDIAEFTRGSFESISSYRTRVFDILRNDVLSDSKRFVRSEPSE